MTIGERIKHRREELGLTVDDLAKALGKHRATVYRYESNEIETLPTSVLEPLSVALSTTPAYLMGWTEGTNEEPKEPELDENYKILSRNAKKLSPDQLKQLLDMARVMFKEEFED